MALMNKLTDSMLYPTDLPFRHQPGQEKQAH